MSGSAVDGIEYQDVRTDRWSVSGRSYWPDDFDSAICKDVFRDSIPYTLVNVILNAVPVYIGFRFIGIKFTGYSCLMILLSGILTDLIPGYSITSDTLLISIFGGIINGSVMSLCLFGNATTGGTDFIAIFLSERKGMDAWNIVLGLNVLILGCSGLPVWLGQGSVFHYLSICFHAGAAHTV